MAIEKKWHLVLTRTNWEKRISDTLNKKNIETFFPVTSIKKLAWVEKRNEIVTAVLPSHLFINIINQQQFLQVGQTKGILNFCYRLSEPAIVSEVDINAIKLFVKLYQNVSFEKTMIPLTGSKKKDIRTIKSEPKFTGSEEDIEKIFLPSIGYYMTGHASKTVDPKILNIDHSSLVNNDLFSIFK